MLDLHAAARDIHNTTTRTSGTSIADIQARENGVGMRVSLLFIWCLDAPYVLARAHVRT